MTFGSHSDPDTFRAQKPAPFIVGAPRSGTTLLRLMLDAHSELAIPHETHFVAPVLLLAEQRPFTADTFADFITTFFTWDDFHLDPAQFREAVGALVPFGLAEAVRLFYRTYAARFHKTRWGEKTPHYALITREIAALLPEAHFIHLIRDGRDVTVSKRHLWFGAGNDIEAQAKDWASIVETTRAAAAGCPRYLEVRFEALVVEPAATLQTICDFLQLSYEPEMLQYHARAEQRLAELNGWPAQGVTKEQFRRLHVHTAAKPRVDRIGRWRSELTRDEIRTFERIAGDTLRALAYQLHDD
jgi:hypothetical protein